MNANAPRGPAGTGSPPAIRSVFAALAVASLGLLNAVDHLVARMMPGSWVAEVRLPSLLTCLALCVASGAAATLRPRAPTRSALIAGAAWLTGAVLSFTLGARFTRFQGTDLVAFLGTGLFAEELLFRGALLELGRRALPAWRAGPVSLASLCAAALFSLSHFQYRGFHATPVALAQVGITFPMGLVLGYLREESRSLWPPSCVHLVSNLISQVAG